LGVWVAQRFLKRLNQENFERLVMVMLVFMGGLLIWQSLAA
jgi:uncharacterized membrane protein YfcA